LTTKQEILDRVRKSLGLPTGQQSVPEDLSAWPDLGQVLAPAADNLISSFEAELASVGGSAHRAKDRAEISRLLSGLLTDRASGVVLSRNPLLERMGLEGLLRDLDVPSWKWPADRGSDPGVDAFTSYRERCFLAAAGITGVDFALAESGTLVLTSFTEGSQLSSLAPPVHIAFYRREQVVGTLEEVLQGLAARPEGGGLTAGRSIVMITGTSRTADIEQILIRGVHGPRELHAILIDDF
jgi:L-lactate dehydrogenase complex protein LldG